MQKSFIPLRKLIAACALVLLMYSCHKDDHGQPCCPPKRACDAQSHLTPTAAAKPEPYQFIKTYGVDGKVNYMDAYPSALWGVVRFQGFVSHSRHLVIMLDSLSGDTLLRAELDDCGRPRSSATLVSSDVHYDQYTYDNKGRLSKIVHTRPSGGFTYQYEYDRYNNVTKIYPSGTPARGLEYQYSYSRPVKGAYYETGVFNLPTFGPRLLEFLGYLDTQPRHQLVKFKNNYEYPEQSLEFKDQTLTATGYLSSYQVYQDGFPSFKGTLNWNCGGHKY
jgi:hypothetical protein